MAGTGIMAGICTSPYPIEKVGDSPYPYPLGVAMRVGPARLGPARIRPAQRRLAHPTPHTLCGLKTLARPA